jgi:hypothetical protein
LAAVRIHSKTTTIFSSRPIISRKRCTDGDWSSEEAFEQVADQRARAAFGREPDRAAGNGTRQPELDQLAQAVFDVLPQAAERLDQHIGVERRGRMRVKVPEDGGPQRRLHQRAESRIDVSRRRPQRRGGGMSAPGAEGEIVLDIGVIG